MQRLTVYMGMPLLYALLETGSRINADLLLPNRILHGKKEGAGHAAD